MLKLRLRTLAATYLKIGNTTFGGGDPTMMALQRELVSTQRVLAPEQFALTYMLARITPGTNILAFCAGTGYQLRGWQGAILAVFAVAIPSAVLAIAVSGAYQKWMSDPFGAAAINATLAAAVGMMFAGAWLMIRPQLSGSVLRATVILGLSLLLVWWIQLSPLQVIGIAVVLGALWPEPESR